VGQTIRKTDYGLFIILLVLGFIGINLFWDLPSPTPKNPSVRSNVETKKPIAFSHRIIKMKVTAYCPCKKCCGKYADGKTSTNRNAWTTLGVAADPKLLPYGTKLKIPGVGIREVDDTGGAMRRSAEKGIYHIDVRFHDHEEAKKFGVKWLDVTVLNPTN